LPRRTRTARAARTMMAQQKQMAAKTRRVVA
jgi:hypothetical protein